MKKAFITGVTGQDGSYLADLLLQHDYEVYGMIRRSSTSNTSRIDHINNDNFHIVYGDLADQASLTGLIGSIQPDEVYNLAAQSHVGMSFKMPEFTADVTGVGPLRLLEAIRLNGLCEKTKFYQASTSELFGKVQEVPQKETTPFYPRSPYGVAKLHAHWSVINYREAYNMYACNGILFNHETLTYSTPLIIKTGDAIDILPIGDVARFRTGVIFDLYNENYQEGKPTTNIKIWDQKGWVDIKWVSGYPHKMDKQPRIINARNHVYSATGSHPCIMEDDSEVKTSDLKIGDKVKNINYPEVNSPEKTSLEKAEWLGMLVADGNISKGRIRFTNKNESLKKRFCELWEIFNPSGHSSSSVSTSGFTGEVVGQVNCCGAKEKYDIYTNDVNPFGHKNKKVPKEILNSSKEVMEAFLVGYNNGDGLKKNPCKYKFKNFKTNSPTLAAGLIYLTTKVTGQKYNITVEESWRWGKQQFYYSINFLSDNTSKTEKYNIVKDLIGKSLSQREIHRQTGISRGFIRKVQNGYCPDDTHHLELCSNEIKKIIEIPNYSGWFFDLETSSGTFHAGIGQGVVHNSPRRGENFVTRKITKTLCNIYKDFHNDSCMWIGNMDAKRDWGDARDYCINLDVPILTPSGWKFYKDISDGDEVINFDVSKNCLSRDKVNKKVLLDSNGDKVTFKGRGLHLNVSHNHRMYYQQKSKKSKGGWSDWKVCTAIELHEKINNLSIRGKYDYRFPHFQEYSYKGKSKFSDDIVWIVGCLLAEGCMSRPKKGRGIEVSLSQSEIANESILSKMRQVSSNLELSFFESTRNDGVVEIRYDSKSSKKIMSWFDTMNVHCMPSWCYGLNKHQAEVLIDAMMDCDGHWGSMTYVSKRHKLAVDFQSIACIAGYRTSSLKIRKDGVSAVCLLSKRKKYTYIQDSLLTNDGHEQVWCVSTSNGTLISRDGGCISISGNCRAMHLMLQQDSPKDYVISSGHQHTVRRFIELTAIELGFTIGWDGKGLDEVGYVDDVADDADLYLDQVIVRVSPEFYRPSEVDTLLGDSTKAKSELSWEPVYTLQDTIKDMVEGDFYA